MTLEGKSFADECIELGEFRKAYIKKHNLKVLGMAEACQLWREHQGDVVAKDVKIQALEEEIREFQHLFEGFSIEKYTNPEFYRSFAAKQYCYSVTMKDMEESFNKFQALRRNHD